MKHSHSVRIFFFKDTLGGAHTGIAHSPEIVDTNINTISAGVREVVRALRATLPRFSDTDMKWMAIELSNQINDNSFTLKIDPINPNRFIVEGFGRALVYLQPNTSTSGALDKVPTIDVHSINGDKFIAVLKDKEDVNIFFSELNAAINPLNFGQR